MCFRTRVHVSLKPPNKSTFPEDEYVKYHVAFDPERIEASLGGKGEERKKSNKNRNSKRVAFDQESTGLMNCITYDPQGPSPSGMETKVFFSFCYQPYYLILSTHITTARNRIRHVKCRICGHQLARAGRILAPLPDAARQRVHIRDGAGGGQDVEKVQGLGVS